MKSLLDGVLMPVTLAMVSLLWIAGCGKPAGTTDGGPVSLEEGAAHHEGDGHDHGDAAHSEGDGHDHAGAEQAHSGWWCAEHGIPEAECSMCSSKVAADFQRKGDWCKEHDRATSQCFICDPKAKEKYAAMYRAKYGKEPPAVPNEG